MKLWRRVAVFWVRARKIETAVRALFIENRMSAREKEREALAWSSREHEGGAMPVGLLEAFHFSLLALSAIVRRALARLKPLGAHTRNLIFLLF
jgi:hypothetical protein